jgi:hypothetical protein
MKVLITLARFMLGGSETYSVTVAEHLERLGHTVTVHAPEASAEGRELATSRGVTLSVGDIQALGEFDAVMTQDAASAYTLACHRPELRQVCAIHGLAAFEQPASGLDPTPPVVVFNDRVARHAAALASRPEVVRMRQPIDIERFRPRGQIRQSARRVLMLSNRPDPARVRVLEEVCRDLGLELAQIGLSSHPKIEPQGAIADADIVVGYGRSILEGMAMGRAAYVWDYGGGEGWVTPESYAEMEADNFRGTATDAVIDADRLRADFAAYRPELGTLGFDLIRLHHAASEHAEDLVGVLEGATPPAPEDAHEALARLVRLEARAAIRVDRLETENGRMREEIQALRERADAAEHALDAVVRSRSWKLAGPFRRISSRLRRLWRRSCFGRAAD